MKIRKAVNEHIKDIAILNITNWRSAYKGLLSDDFLSQLNLEEMMKTWESYLSQNTNQVFIVEEKGKILGYSACREDSEIKNCCYLETLQVNEKVQGKGIGTKLIQHIGHYAYVNGYQCMSICIIKGNDKARNLYLKLGAKHYQDFVDDFHGISSDSEKLIWDNTLYFKNQE